MNDDAAPGGHPLGGDELDYTLVPARIAELAERLERYHDREVVATVGELLDWIDAFHLTGLRELVAMIAEWRGEIFLEHASAHPVVGLLLDGYGLSVDPASGPRGGDATGGPGVAAGSPPVAVRIGRKPQP